MLRTDPHHIAAIDPASRQYPLVLPRFKYDVPKAGARPHGSIKVGSEVVHAMEDMSAFYAALGYDKSAKDNGLAEEVFVWQRYTSDGSKMSRDCLQVQMATYLNTHASQFMAQYRQAYDAMRGQCGSQVRDDHDLHCANCPMHPHPSTA